MRTSQFLLVAVIVVMVGACSNTPTKQDMALDEAKAAKVRDQAAAEQRDREQARMEAKLTQVPAWALQPPAPDSNGVYAVGIGESDKLREAMRKAMLDAEFGLAKNFNQELSGSERAYNQDSNGRVTQQQYTELVDKLVSQVSVVGFEVVKQEVMPIDGVFNAYVLLKLPYQEFNRVLSERRASATNKDIKEAFNDLQGRLAERRKQRLEEERQKQDGVASAQSQSTGNTTAVATVDSVVKAGATRE